MTPLTTLLLTSLLVLAPYASASPVDTTQYGHIKEGMGEAEVLRRLGDPDKRVVIDKYIASTRVRGVSIGREQVKEALVYLGGGNLMDTYIILLNGSVIGKDKRR